MKRVVSLLMLVCLLLPAMAQETTLPPTVRNHNIYTVGNQVMDKRAYQGYLKNTCPEAYSKFKSAYTTSIVGWSFFGTGLVMETIADAYAISYFAQGGKFSTFTRDCGGLAICSWVGFAFTVTGIVCVSVGYCNMHKAADIYNVKTQQKQPVTLSMKPTANGMGLALNF